METSNSQAATPYTTAPSTPLFYSAPTSPIHALVLGFQQDHDHDYDFAFSFTQPPSIPSSSAAADDLFHAGIIKPLKPIYDELPTSKNLDDSFSRALSRTPGERTQTPPRISDILCDEQHNNRKNSLTWYSKWNLKNLMLFRRSASEGSARRSKDNPVNNYYKYSRITKGDEEGVMKISRCRSGDGCSSTRKMSAHEMHYTANRAVAEEMRRKTYLPYKSGLFGCLGLHNNGAANVHHISRGVNSVLKQQHSC